MLLVPICALVLLAVSVYLISRTSDNVAAIADNTYAFATNFDGFSNNSLSLATEMTPQMINGQSHFAFPTEVISQIIESRDVLTSERNVLYDEWKGLTKERDRLKRDTTITVSLSMFFVVASFLLAFFLPASRPATAAPVEEEEADEESSEETEDKSS